MPTYEYECAKCKRRFDWFQRMTEKALTTCPEKVCQEKPWGKGKVKRQVGAGAGLIFKGSGFYATDYRSEGYKAAAKKDTGAASAASTASAKKDSKAATAPAPAKTESGGDKKKD